MTTTPKESWTKEKVSELIGYWWQSMPKAEIASRLGTTVSSVKTRAVRSGLPPYVNGRLDLTPYPKGKLRKCSCCTYEFFTPDKTRIVMCDDCKRTEAGDPWMS